MRRIVLCVIAFLLVNPMLAQSEGSRRIPTDNLSYPVSIAFGSKAVASGFYLNAGNNSYLVTAKHVLYEDDGVTLKRPEIEVTSYGRDPQDRTPLVLNLHLETIAQSGGVKAHRTHDVVVVIIGTSRGGPEDNNVSLVPGAKFQARPRDGIVTVAIAAVKRFADVLVSNEVVVFGYPTSIGIPSTPQIDYRKPLLRKGIVAGTNEEHKTIVLDCPVFGGNSGGPVVELTPAGRGTRFQIIGVVIQMVPFVQTVIGKGGGASRRNVGEFRLRNRQRDGSSP